MLKKLLNRLLMSSHALIIPYRNREEHLNVLINRLKEMNIQKMDIIVIHQNDDLPFNRGFLFNVVLDFYQKYDYYIFHDVDLIPQDNIQYCQDYLVPTHLSCYCEQFNYRLLDNLDYENSKMFGGIVAMSRKNFIKIGGYCDRYAGWGYEDNDLYRRVLSRIGSFERKPWKYNSLEHPRTHENHENLLCNKILYEKNIHFKRRTSGNITTEQKDILWLHVSTDHLYIECVHISDNTKLLHNYSIKKDLIVTSRNIDHVPFIYRSWSILLKRSTVISKDVFFIKWNDILPFLYTKYVPWKLQPKMSSPFMIYEKEKDCFVKKYITFCPISFNDYIKKSNSEEQNINWYQNPDLYGKFINHRERFIEEERYSMIETNFEKKHKENNNFVLYVTHPGGGGVEKHLKMMTQHTKNPTILRPNCNKHNILTLEVNGVEIYYHEIEIYKLYNDIINLGIELIIINHLMIYSDQVLQMILFLNKEYNIPMITICHDTVYLCPDSCSRKVKRRKHYDYIKYRKQIVQNSLYTFCPSEYLANFYIYNKLCKNPIILSIDIVPTTTIHKGSSQNKIMVFGTFKGDTEMLKFLNERSDYIIDFYGSTNIKHERLINNGKYSDDDIVNLINISDPKFIWFPSKKPETFCYALSYALISEYPIVAFNIGAIKYRLENIDRTFLFPISDSLHNHIDNIIFDKPLQTIYREVINSKQYMNKIISLLPNLSKVLC